MKHLEPRKMIHGFAKRMKLKTEWLQSVCEHLGECAFGRVSVYVHLVVWVCVHLGESVHLVECVCVFGRVHLVECECVCIW